MNRIKSFADRCVSLFQSKILQILLILSKIPCVFASYALCVILKSLPLKLLHWNDGGYKNNCK
jgi:hypothetical protein